MYEETGEVGGSHPVPGPLGRSDLQPGVTVAIHLSPFRPENRCQGHLPETQSRAHHSSAQRTLQCA